MAKFQILVDFDVEVDVSGNMMNVRVAWAHTTLEMSFPTTIPRGIIAAQLEREELPTTLADIILTMARSRNKRATALTDVLFGTS